MLRNRLFKRDLAFGLAFMLVLAIACATPAPTQPPTPTPSPAPTSTPTPSPTPTLTTTLTPTPTPTSTPTSIPAPMPTPIATPDRVRGVTNNLLWWQGVNIFSVAGGKDRLLVDSMVGTSVRNGVLVAELAWQQQNNWREIGRTQAEGMRIVGAISANGSSAKLFVERPELVDTAVIDIYGKPIIQEWKPTSEGPLWWGNTNHPLWQAFLLEQARSLVDAGVDGIAIDETLGTAGSIWAGGSFGESDMSQFRAYLAEVYTPEQLRDQFGISRIETFNFREYINTSGLTDTWTTAAWQVPLYWDFWRFQRRATKEFMTKLVQETRMYAKTNYGRQVAFTANISMLHPYNLIFADLLDYYIDEYPYIDYGYPPESSAVPEYKLARALGNKLAVVIPSTGTAADLVNRKSSSALMSLFIAEAYASQGALTVPHSIYGWSKSGGPTTYSGDMLVLAPIYRFVGDYAFLYEEMKSLAQVAVLYSYPTDDHTWDGYRQAFRGLTYALLDGQVQFDIVALGDNVWLKDSFSEESLAPYRVAFLPQAAYLSDAQVDSVLSFVSGGGTVIAWGSTGIYDEAGYKLEREELAALTVPGTHAYGKGWFITLSGDPGDTYRQTNDLTVRQQLVSLVNNYADTVTATTAAPLLNVLAYKSADSRQVVVHLVNYDYSIATDHVRPTGPFTLTLRPPPPGLVDKDQIQVYLLSPNRETPSLLDFRVVDGSLVIDHPGVDIYDALVVVSQTDARALANETLDLLTDRITRARSNGFSISPLEQLLAQIDEATSSGNYLFARQLGSDALDRLHVLARPRVLFDEAHGERNTLSWERALALSPEHPEWVYFGKLAAALKDDFIFDRNADSFLTPELLKGYQALVLSAPQETLDKAELAAVHQFVAGGGGLVVLGDCGIDRPVNALISAYNMTLNAKGCVFTVSKQEGDFFMREFANHEATRDVPFMALNWGGWLATGEPVEVLSSTGEDTWQDTNGDRKYDPGEPRGPFAMAGAYEVGPARVVVVADNALMDDSFEWRSNDLLIRSLLKWVTGWREPR